MYIPNSVGSQDGANRSTITQQSLRRKNIYPPLMPSTLKFGFKPGADHINNHFNAQNSGTKTENIGIVMLPAHSGSIGFVA